MSNHRSLFAPLNLGGQLLKNRIVLPPSTRQRAGRPAHTKRRADEYGGSLSNRLRLLREVVQAVAAVVGPERRGVCFIANPDLLQRIANGWPLNPLDASTLYGGAAAGLTDYPSYAHITEGEPA